MQSASTSVVIAVLLLLGWPHVLEVGGPGRRRDAIQVGRPGFPADRTQQKSADNAVPDRSCKDKAAERAMKMTPVMGAADEFSPQHWGER